MTNYENQPIDVEEIIASKISNLLAAAFGVDMGFEDVDDLREAELYLQARAVVELTMIREAVHRHLYDDEDKPWL